MKKQLLIFAILASSFSYGQLDQFSNTLNSFFSTPEEYGWMYFSTPNNYPVGACFQYYKTIENDTDNDMILVDQHTDNILGMTHYKFQQTYKGVLVEAAGCIEHYDASGSLVVTNAKHAVNLNLNVIPEISQIRAMDEFIDHMPNGFQYAWDDPQLELEYQIEMDDSTASRFPNPELILALDTAKNILYNIPGSRYRLAYKIKAVTLNPIVARVYYMDANTGDIFRMQDLAKDDGPANINTFGIQTIDTEFAGGFTQSNILYAQNGARNIHTKKKVSNSPITTWATVQNVTDDDDNWAFSDVHETTAHFFATQSWDFFESEYGRTGFDNNGLEVRVRTQWGQNNAQYENALLSKPIMRFGTTNGGQFYSNDLSIVAHEYGHGITDYTADLIYQDESGALNESMSDIFGTAVESWYIGGGNLGLFVDWTLGNQILNPIRSLADPKIYFHPDTYQGEYWFTGPQDNGGVHTNSGVANKWYYILCEGETSQNDNGDLYMVDGIGMSKATKIAYVALASFMQAGSQYVDGRFATIEAAKQLYGECSFEYQQTIDAWYAVGVGNENDCLFTVSTDELVKYSEVLIYPNPTKESINVYIPTYSEKEITIYNASGKIVKIVNSNDQITQMDVGELTTGMYTILCNLNGNIITKKFIKE